MPLLSDWFVVCTAGDSVDGRVIQPEWLEEAAQTYSKKKYTSVVNFNHWPKTWAGTYGAVDSLKIGQSEDGKVQLLARIEPNDNLIQLSRREVLFTSVELTPNFLESGKWYMDGLAVTSDPASSGTDRVTFACKAKPEGERVYSDYVQTAMTFSEQTDDEALGWLTKLFSSMDKNKVNEKEGDMSLEKKVDDLAGSVEKLTQLFAKQNPQEPEVNIDDATIEALKAQGYTVEKIPTDQEVEAQVEALKAMGFTIEAPTKQTPPEGGETEHVTKQEFQALLQKINDLSGQEVFTKIGNENPGSDEDGLGHL